MITNESDFKTAIALIRTPLSMSISDLSGKMISEEINYNNAAIHTALNELYERVRLLEDAKLYIADHVTKQVREKRKSFMDTIYSIERNMDAAASSDDGIVITPKWIDGVVRDRNNTLIQNGRTVNDSIYPESKLLYRADISLISHTSDSVPYSVTIDSGNTCYEALYIENVPDSAIVDTITILFKEPKEINYIGFDTANIDYSVAYISELNETIDTDANRYIVPVIAKGIVITAVCRNYVKMTRSTSVTFNDALSELSVASAASLTTGSEAEALLSKVRYDNDVDRFLSEVKKS